MKRFNWIAPVALAAVLLLAGGNAFADDGAAGAGWQGYVGLGAGLAMGFAVLGGGIGQGMAARGALEGIARNPQASGKIQTPMLLGLAFVESLVIFTFAIAFLLQAKIGG